MIHLQCEKLATGLLHLGLNRGDRVGIWGPNLYEWIVCQFATALAGMILASISYFSNKRIIQ